MKADEARALADAALPTVIKEKIHEVELGIEALAKQGKYELVALASQNDIAKKVADHFLALGYGVSYGGAGNIYINWSRG